MNETKTNDIEVTRGERGDKAPYVWPFGRGVEPPILVMGSIIHLHIGESLRLDDARRYRDALNVAIEIAETEAKEEKAG